MGKQFIDIVRHSSIKVGGCSTIFLEDLRRRHPFSSYYTTLGDAGRLERPKERSEHTNTSSLYARPPPRPTSGERMHAPAWPEGVVCAKGWGGGGGAFRKERESTAMWRTVHRQTVRHIASTHGGEGGGYQSGGARVPGAPTRAA